MLLPHRDVAVGMVVRATGRLAEAEDCVHDAMLRLARRDDLDPTRVRSLLIRAALHIAIDHRRAAAREQSAVVKLGGGARGDAVSPEQVQQLRSEVARVLAAVDSLPRRERQVMRLRLAGLNVAETATRLGISPKSVEGAYTRARARVRHLLGGLLGWLADRLRRMASTRGEAAATTVAALLFAAPGWSGPGDVRGEPHVAPKTADSPLRSAVNRPAQVEPAKPPPPRRAEQPRAESPVLPPRPHTLRPGGNSGRRLHNPPPDADISVPIDAPFGLASFGVYVNGSPTSTDPQTYTAWTQYCLDHPDPQGRYFIC
jgi:RNA polymerase sigma-70 factor (ECF subfamily)